MEDFLHSRLYMNTHTNLYFECHRLSDIVHRRHYDISLRLDQLFKFSKLAKLQKKLLHTIHSQTENVIQEKWKDIEEKQKTRMQEIVEKKSIATDSTENDNYSRLYYARDDLEDIDESDVSEKKRLPFLEMLMDIKTNSGQMTDEEIWEEVNTFMFEV